MKAAIIFFALSFVIITLIENSYQIGHTRGYDEGMEDSIEIFQEYLKEEKENERAN